MTLSIPAQRTWAVADIVTAAEMNANVRDAVNFLVNPPQCVAYQNTGQSVPSSTSTGVLFDTNLTDPYGGHSTSVNNNRYFAQIAGWYQITYDLQYASNATGVREAIILVNLATTNPPARSIIPAAALPVENNVTGTFFLNVGDSTSVAAFQSSGSALVLSNASMNVRWVHA